LHTSPGSKTSSEAGNKTAQAGKKSGALTLHNKTTSPGSKTSSEPGSKTKQTGEMSSTSSKKKKRRGTTSSRNKRQKVYHPLSSHAKAKRGSGHTPSDDDDSYSGGNGISSSSETEDDNILADQRKKKADNRKKPPKQTEESSVVEESTVEPTPGPTAQQAQQQADDLRAALIASEAGRSRAEQQVRNISKVKLADDFLIGQIRTWSKEVLWKQCKFITNHTTMSKVMRKAAKKFKVTDEEKDHWMATYAHTVRDGLNQKRNAVAQDLRLTVISKYDTLKCCCWENIIVTHHSVCLHKKEQRDFYPAQLAKLENLTNVRGMTVDGDPMAFQLFFDKLLPAVAG